MNGLWQVLFMPVIAHRTSHLVSETYYILKTKKKMESKRALYLWIFRSKVDTARLQLCVTCGEGQGHISVVHLVRYMHDRNERSCQSRYRVASRPPFLTELTGSKLQHIRFYKRKEQPIERKINTDITAEQAYLYIPPLLHTRYQVLYKYGLKSYYNRCTLHISELAVEKS